MCIAENHGRIRSTPRRRSRRAGEGSCPRMHDGLQAPQAGALSAVSVCERESHL